MNMIERIDDWYDHHTYAEVERLMLEARDAIMAGGDGSPADLVAVCNELGGLYREQSRYGESAYNFELALDTTRRIKGTDEAEECAVLMINVAGTYRYAGEFEKALEYYGSARRTLEALGKRDTYEYASVLNNMSNAYQDTGRFDEALACAREAYAYIREHNAGETEEAISLMNIAALTARQGDLDAAWDSASRAAGIYEALGKTGGHYPAAVNMKAVVAFRRGDFAEALAGFERSAELTKATFGENRDYAAALSNIALVLDRLGRPDEAAGRQAEADRIRATLK